LEGIYLREEKKKPGSEPGNEVFTTGILPKHPADYIFLSRCHKHREELKYR
jgi:hypothetical protein